MDTHTHADHISGAKDLKHKTTAKIVMHEKAPASCVDMRSRTATASGGRRFDQVHPHAGTRQGPCLRNAARPHPYRRRPAHRVLRAHRSPQRQRGPPVPHALLHLPRPPDDLLVYPGHDYNGREHSILKEEKESNPKMLFDTEEEFVEYMERENPGKLTPVYHLADALKANMA